MNKLFCLLCILMSFGLSADLDKDFLIFKTQSYLNLIDKIGHGKEYSVDDAEILAFDIKKVLNGDLFTQDRKSFIDDLKSVHQQVGDWSLTPKDVLFDVEQKTVVLQVMTDIDALGNFTAIVILKFNDAGQIKELNEVFCKREGQYNF